MLNIHPVSLSLLCSQDLSGSQDFRTWSRLLRGHSALKQRRVFTVCSDESAVWKPSLWKGGVTSSTSFETVAAVSVPRDFQSCGNTRKPACWEEKSSGQKPRVFGKTLGRKEPVLCCGFDVTLKLWKTFCFFWELDTHSKPGKRCFLILASTTLSGCLFGKVRQSHTFSSRHFVFIL